MDTIVSPSARLYLTSCAARAAHSLAAVYETPLRTLGLVIQLELFELSIILGEFYPFGFLEGDRMTGVTTGSEQLDAVFIYQPQGTSSKGTKRRLSLGCHSIDE